MMAGTNRVRERSSREVRSKFIEQVRQEDWDRGLLIQEKYLYATDWSRCITDAIAAAAAAANDQETDIVRYDLQMRLGFCSFAAFADQHQVE